jgi:hypothetical protein
MLCVLRKQRVHMIRHYNRRNQCQALAVKMLKRFGDDLRAIAPAQNA